MAYIYIAFVDTPGFFAALVRKFLKQRYIHVVISGDAMLEDAYSVGRRNPAIPFGAGFEKEEKGKILNAFPTAAYRICEIPCTYEQKQKIMERLHNDYERRFHIHYAVCSLPFIVMGIPIYLKSQYTCSSYIAKLLQENFICIGGPDGSSCDLQICACPDGDWDPAFLESAFKGIFERILLDVFSGTVSQHFCGACIASGHVFSGSHP